MIHFISLSLITRSFNVTDPIFETLALFCVQGLQPVGNHFSKKLWILTLCFAFFIIYNLYTSTVLSELLKSSSKIPSTIDEIIESSLQLYFEDFAYMNKYFNTHKTDENFKKILKKSQRGNVPLFKKRESLIKMIKHGSAFVCEQMAAYAFFENGLEPEEICRLREAVNLILNDNSYFKLVAQKDSQYIEMLRYGMIKSVEYGFNHRELLIYRKRRPLCQSNSIVEFVCFKQVKSAFFLLGIAFYISFIVLGLENLYHLRH